MIVIHSKVLGTDGTTTDPHVKHRFYRPNNGLEEIDIELKYKETDDLVFYLRN